MLEEVTLAGKHVRLEPLRRAHVDDLWDAASEPEIWTYLGRFVRSKPDLARWIDGRVKAAEAGTALAFVQRDARSGLAYGSSSLFDVDLAMRRAEIGHTWVGRTHRRTAANTESKLLMLAHAFDALGANRVQLKTDARNLRSQAAIERLGATKEGTLRSFTVYEDGQVTDRVLYSIIRPEWPDVRRRLESFLSRSSPASVA